MNILREVEKEHSRVMRTRIVKHVGTNPARFKELVNIYLAGPWRNTQRAAWPLSYCVQQHPALIKPHLKKILNYVKTPGAPDAVKRNTVRLLQLIDIPKSFQGEVANMCFSFLSDTSEPIAVRVFSMVVLGNIAKVQPELKDELRIIIEDQLPYGSSGFVNRGRKILKQLARDKSSEK